jgi:chitin disaccharide deacetylase
LALSSGSSSDISAVRRGARARVLKLLASSARKKVSSSGLSTADYFCGIAQTGHLTLQGVTQLLKMLPEGSTEFMCHPGYADQELQNSSTRLQGSRRAELEIFTNPRLRNFVAQQGIHLINYRRLAEQA